MTNGELYDLITSKRCAVLVPVLVSEDIMFVKADKKDLVNIIKKGHPDDTARWVAEDQGNEIYLHAQD